MSTKTARSKATPVTAKPDKQLAVAAGESATAQWRRDHRGELSTERLARAQAPCSAVTSGWAWRARPELSELVSPDQS
jgi:hypothetical protein